MYSLIPGCTLRSIGNQHLLIVHPPSGAPYAMEVNGSFAHLFSLVQESGGTFSEDGLVSCLMEDYALDAQQAQAEVEKTIALWKEHGLLLL